MVVEPRWGAGADRPVPGAVVMVDCAAGRIVARTDDQGRARIGSLSLTSDPVSVSAYVATLETIRTRIAVGPEALGRPFTIPVRHYRTHGLTTETVRGAIEHSAAGRAAHCWIESSSVPGGRLPEHRFTTGSYELRWMPELGTMARITCLELTVIDAATVRVEAFAEAEVTAGAEEGPTISFAGGDTAITRRDVTLALHETFGAVTSVEVAVLDTRPELGVGIGTLESYEVGDGGALTVHIAYAEAAARGAPAIRARVLTMGGQPAYVYRGALADIDGPIDVPEAPIATISFGLREVAISGADWTTDYGLYLSYPLPGAALVDHGPERRHELPRAGSSAGAHRHPGARRGRLAALLLRISLPRRHAAARRLQHGVLGRARPRYRVP
ncbi:MAG: hypothetical protein M5U28_39350 [Sandaracinaceae bacterium]|nr:hypothetical protein [Sandaracinaceae bacterium]